MHMQIVDSTGQHVFQWDNTPWRVDQGGTGATSFPSGGFLFGNGTSAIDATSSPTVGYITATSTTDTSVFNGNTVFKGPISILSDILFPYDSNANEKILRTEDTVNGEKPNDINIIAGSGYGVGGEGAMAAIDAGEGGGNSNGGRVEVFAGSSLGSGNGGKIDVSSGHGGYTSGNGGLLQLDAGNARGSGNGGDILLMVGNGANGGREGKFVFRNYLYSATTTIEFGAIGHSDSHACFNTKNTDGGDISFYFVGTSMVVENNTCR
jgi:hypothetical protein